MKPGVYSDISNEAYHGGPGISKSGLDLIHRSALHYHSVVTAANDRTPTPAQAIGTAAHAIILEPAEFTKNYCLSLRRQDVPDAIDDREQLVALVEAINNERIAAHPSAIRDSEQLIAMLNELNETRLPKLLTTGTKADQIARIREAYGAEDGAELLIGGEPVELLKGGELKAALEALNADRAGKLSTSGSTKELAARLRENGVDVFLWSEVLESHLAAHGTPYVLSTSSTSRHDMAAWLNANGKPVTLWSDVLEEWQRNNGERIVLSEDAWNQLHAMRDAVMAHPAAYGVLTKGKNVVVDLKTTDDASLEGFAKSIANWRYDVQHPYYLDGLKEAIRQGNCTPPVDGTAELSAYWIDEETGVLCRCRPDFWRGNPNNFVFIAVEKKPPYAVGVYVLDSESVDAGRAVYRADLNTYAACQKSGEWPGYGDKIQTINVPGWHANKNQKFIEGVA